MFGMQGGCSGNSVAVSSGGATNGATAASGSASAGDQATTGGDDTAATGNGADNGNGNGGSATEDGSATGGITQQEPQKTSYRDGEKATLAGTVVIYETDNPGFAGEAMWAYLKLDSPITISGSAEYGKSKQDRLQLSADFNWEAASEQHELTIPEWEPYDGKRVTVSGTIRAVATWNFYWLDPYWLEDATVTG